MTVINEAWTGESGEQEIWDAGAEQGPCSLAELLGESVMQMLLLTRYSFSAN